ncbi:hypothetical protein DFP72DRAFT_863411 [Ephemerocybe angulata]|uniref:Uncharacterized protein n=1 Tax=Ephemerocybe angulata TaxID=980116 RepID=A0A8H6LTX8_9AGAR|nr:hypothetical protein DFP72DRAFT_863411 [Tulosesus angulatus]
MTNSIPSNLPPLKECDHLSIAPDNAISLAAQSLWTALTFMGSRNDRSVTPILDLLFVLAIRRTGCTRTAAAITRRLSELSMEKNYMDDWLRTHVENMALKRFGEVVKPKDERSRRMARLFADMYSFSIITRNNYEKAIRGVHQRFSFSQSESEAHIGEMTCRTWPGYTIGDKSTDVFINEHPVKDSDDLKKLCDEISTDAGEISKGQIFYNYDAQVQATERISYLLRDLRRITPPPMRDTK